MYVALTLTLSLYFSVFLYSVSHPSARPFLRSLVSSSASSSRSRPTALLSAAYGHASPQLPPCVEAAVLQCLSGSMFAGDRDGRSYHRKNVSLLSQQLYTCLLKLRPKDLLSLTKDLPDSSAFHCAVLETGVLRPFVRDNSETCGCENRFADQGSFNSNLPLNFSGSESKPRSYLFDSPNPNRSTSCLQLVVGLYQETSFFIQRYPYLT